MRIAPAIPLQGDTRRLRVHGVDQSNLIARRGGAQGEPFAALRLELNDIVFRRGRQFGGMEIQRSGGLDLLVLGAKEFEGLGWCIGNGHRIALGQFKKVQHRVHSDDNQSEQMLVLFQLLDNGREVNKSRLQNRFRIEQVDVKFDHLLPPLGPVDPFIIRQLLREFLNFRSYLRFNLTLSSFLANPVHQRRRRRPFDLTNRILLFNRRENEILAQVDAPPAFQGTTRSKQIIEYLQRRFPAFFLLFHGRAIVQLREPLIFDLARCTRRMGSSSLDNGVVSVCFCKEKA